MREHTAPNRQGGQTASFQRYSTLVVKDFENSAGDGVPWQVGQDVARAVVTRLNECYPGAFAKIETTPSGLAEELVVAGTITEYREGSRFARAMLIGLGSAKFASDVAYVDGQTGQAVAQVKVDLLWAMGGIVGAATGIEDLVKKAGTQIADDLADKRGMAKQC